MFNLASQVRIINNDSITLVIGMPVASVGNGLVRAAQANSQLLSNVLGLVVTTSVGMTLVGRAATSGPLEATTVQWDAVTGQVGGLTPDAIYFLDPSTQGGLTTTPPSAQGQYVVQIGIALSPTIIRIGVQQSIRL